MKCQFTLIMFKFLGAKVSKLAKILNSLKKFKKIMVGICYNYHSTEDVIVS